MKILAIGDVVGRPGRTCLKTLLPKIRAEHEPDFVIINGENIAGGFGITLKIYHELIDKFEIDAITTGNHWADKREIFPKLDEMDRLVLPANMGNVDEFRHGFREIKSKSGIPVTVVNLIGRAFMHSENTCPYAMADQLFGRFADSKPVRVVDMHAEATSEKQGMGRFLTSRASLVYGTHTHVPTADERILSGHTGYQTDLGMTAGYDSVIGMRTELALRRMQTQTKVRMEPAKGEPWLCGVLADIDEKNGRCKEITRLQYRTNEIDDTV